MAEWWSEWGEITLRPRYCVVAGPPPEGVRSLFGDIVGDIVGPVSDIIGAALSEFKGPVTEIVHFVVSNLLGGLIKTIAAAVEHIFPGLPTLEKRGLAALGRLGELVPKAAAALEEALGAALRGVAEVGDDAVGAGRAALSAVDAAFGDLRVVVERLEVRTKLLVAKAGEDIDAAAMGVGGYMEEAVGLFKPGGGLDFALEGALRALGDLPAAAADGVRSGVGDALGEARLAFGELTAEIKDWGAAAESALAEAELALAEALRRVAVDASGAVQAASVGAALALSGASREIAACGGEVAHQVKEIEGALGAKQALVAADIGGAVAVVRSEVTGPAVDAAKAVEDAVGALAWYLDRLGLFLSVGVLCAGLVLIILARRDAHAYVADAVRGVW